MMTWWDDYIGFVVPIDGLYPIEWKCSSEQLLLAHLFQKCRNNEEGKSRIRSRYKAGQEVWVFLPKNALKSSESLVRIRKSATN